MAGFPAPKKNANGNDAEGDGSDNNVDLDAAFFASIQKLKKGDILDVKSLDIKEGETSPPKRYNSGSMILAMENAGQRSRMRNFVRRSKEAGSEPVRPGRRS